MNVIERALDRHPVMIGFVIGWVTSYAALGFVKNDSSGKDDGHAAGADRVTHRELAAGVRLDGEGGEAAKTGTVGEADVDYGHGTLAGIGDDDECVRSHELVVVATVDRDGWLTLRLPAEVKTHLLKDEGEGDAEKGEDAR